MKVGLLASVSALALVGYVGAVIYQGNLAALVAMLATDWRFLDWAVAIGLLYALAKMDNLGGPVSLIIGVAVIAMLLKLVNGSNSIALAVKDFGAGNLGLFDIAAIVGTQAGKSLGLQPLYSQTLPIQPPIRGSIMQ